VPGCEHRTGWRQISRLALVWLSLALPTVAAATPVKYQFSWQGTLVQSLSGVSANMSFTANTADVFTGMDPGGDFAVNLGPGFGGLTGVFSGAGLTGVFSGLEVSRESATSGPDLLLFRDQGSGANPIYELGLFADDPTGIGAYNLDAPFGPVNGNGVLSGSPSFDFGADGVLTFSAIDTASFEAVAIQQAPEPSALWLIIAGLLLGWWFLRKGKRSPV
jgi:hypothetical protein